MIYNECPRQYCGGSLRYSNDMYLCSLCARTPDMHYLATKEQRKATAAERKATNLIDKVIKTGKDFGKVVEISKNSRSSYDMYGDLE